MVFVLMLQAILLIVGLVRICLRDHRTHGFITIGNSLLFALALFLLDNGYMPIVGMVIFVAAAIPLGIRHLNLGAVVLFFLFAGFASGPPSSSGDDVTAWATGDEQSVDIVSMSD